MLYGFYDMACVCEIGGSTPKTLKVNLHFENGNSLEITMFKRQVAKSNIFEWCDFWITQKVSK